MNLDNLTNPELDRLCAEKMEWKLDGFSLEEDRFGDILMDEYETPKLYFSPTTNKDQCFDLLIENLLTVTPPCYGSGKWSAEVYVPKGDDNHRFRFHTEDTDPLRAIVKAYIMSKGE